MPNVCRIVLTLTLCALPLGLAQAAKTETSQYFTIESKVFRVFHEVNEDRPKLRSGKNGEESVETRLVALDAGSVAGDFPAFEECRRALEEKFGADGPILLSSDHEALPSRIIHTPVKKHKALLNGKQSTGERGAAINKQPRAKLVQPPLEVDLHVYVVSVLSGRARLELSGKLVFRPQSSYLGVDVGPIPQVKIAVPLDDWQALFFPLPDPARSDLVCAFRVRKSTPSEVRAAKAPPKIAPGTPRQYVIESSLYRSLDEFWRTAAKDPALASGVSIDAGLFDRMTRFAACKQALEGALGRTDPVTSRKWYFSMPRHEIHTPPGTMNCLSFGDKYVPPIEPAPGEPRTLFWHIRSLMSPGSWLNISVQPAAEGSVRLDITRPLKNPASGKSIEGEALSMWDDGQSLKMRNRTQRDAVDCATCTVLPLGTWHAFCWTLPDEDDGVLFYVFRVTEEGLPNMIPVQADANSPTPRVAPMPDPEPEPALYTGKALVYRLPAKPSEDFMGSLASLPTGNESGNGQRTFSVRSLGSDNADLSFIEKMGRFLEAKGAKVLLNTPWTLFHPYGQKRTAYEEELKLREGSFRIPDVFLVDHTQIEPCTVLSPSHFNTRIDEITHYATRGVRLGLRAQPQENGKSHRLDLALFCNERPPTFPTPAELGDVTGHTIDVRTRLTAEDGQWVGTLFPLDDAGDLIITLTTVEEVPPLPLHARPNQTGGLQCSVQAQFHRITGNAVDSFLDSLEYDLVNHAIAGEARLVRFPGNSEPHTGVAETFEQLRALGCSTELLTAPRISSMCLDAKLAGTLGRAAKGWNLPRRMFVPDEAFGTGSDGRLFLPNAPSDSLAGGYRCGKPGDLMMSLDQPGALLRQAQSQGRFWWVAICDYATLEAGGESTPSGKDWDGFTLAHRTTGHSEWDHLNLDLLLHRRYRVSSDADKAGFLRKGRTHDAPEMADVSARFRLTVKDGEFVGVVFVPEKRVDNECLFVSVKADIIDPSGYSSMEPHKMYIPPSKAESK